MSVQSSPFSPREVFFYRCRVPTGLPTGCRLEVRKHTAGTRCATCVGRLFADKRCGASAWSCSREAGGPYWGVVALTSGVRHCCPADRPLAMRSRWARLTVSEPLRLISFVRTVAGRYLNVASDQVARPRRRPLLWAASDRVAVTAPSEHIICVGTTGDSSMQLVVNDPLIFAFYAARHFGCCFARHGVFPCSCASQADEVYFLCTYRNLSSPLHAYAC